MDWLSAVSALLSAAASSYGNSSSSAASTGTTSSVPATTSATGTNSTSGGIDWWGIGSSVIQAAPGILGALESGEKREYDEEQKALDREFQREKFEWEKQQAEANRADAGNKFAQKMQAEAFNRLLGAYGLASTNQRVTGAKRVESLQQLAALGAAAAVKGGRG